MKHHDHFILLSSGQGELVTCGTLQSSFQENPQVLLILSWAFFCLSLSDSPITQTVPVLSSWCLGVKFIPFTIDSRGGAFVFLGQRDALKLFVEKEAYVVSLNCFREVGDEIVFQGTETEFLIFEVLATQSFAMMELQQHL